MQIDILRMVVPSQGKWDPLKTTFVSRKRSGPERLRSSRHAPSSLVREPEGLLPKLDGVLKSIAELSVRPFLHGVIVIHQAAQKRLRVICI